MEVFIRHPGTFDYRWLVLDGETPVDFGAALTRESAEAKAERAIEEHEQEDYSGHVSSEDFMRRRSAKHRADIG